MHKYSSWHFTSAALLVLGVSLSFVLFGCSSAGAGSGGGGSTTLTNGQATTATQTIGGAVGLILANQSNWNTSGSNVTYSPGYGLSMSGTDAASSGTTAETLDLTFSNYSDSATGYTVNGSATLTLNLNSSMAATSGSLTTGSGNLVLSGGTVTSESLDITDITSTTGGVPVYTFTGSVGCNGTSFKASSLDLGGTELAQTGTLAVIDGLSVIISNMSSWTSTGSNSYSYGSSGVSMTATSTTSGPDTTYTMKLTFGSFTDSPTGYTLTSGSNALTLVYTVVTSTGQSVSIKLSGGPVTFSGGGSGSVTTQSWNNVMATNNGTATTVTGTVSSNGTLFDAKTVLNVI